MRITALLGLACLFAGIACSQETPQSGIDLKAIDKTADPCTDFYQYACGAWM